MTESERAAQAWEASAEAWIELAPKDTNRTVLLDPVMLDVAGDVVGRTVLDVGCGEGRFCRMLGERGASVFGLDPTVGLIRRAASLDPTGNYVVASAEAIPVPEASFDLVVSYIVLVDIPDFRQGLREMARALRPSGRLIIANLNSFATTRERAWHRDEAGNRLHVAVEEYFTERASLLSWGGLSIYNWHRPMEAYFQALLAAGLLLRDFREPRPSPDAVRANPSMEDDAIVPLFHVMAWEKPLG